MTDEETSAIPMAHTLSATVSEGSSSSKVLVKLPATHDSDSSQTSDGGVQPQPHAPSSTSSGRESEMERPGAPKYCERAAELPCLCWIDLDGPRYKMTQSRKPISLNYIYPSIRSVSLISAHHLNDFIELCRVETLRRRAIPSTETRPDDQFRQQIATYRNTIVTDIEEAITSLRTSPGYACRADSKPHAECFAERERGLQEFEDSISSDLEEVSNLDSVREEISRFESRLQRYKLIQMAVRAVSIATVPYSPLASALITAVDLFGISANHAIEDFLTSDTMSRLKYNVTRLDKIHTALQENLAKVKRLRDHLEALKAQIEWEQRQPGAARLSDILDTLYAAKFAVDGALSSHCERCESQCAPVPMREIVKAYKNIAEALEAPTMISGPLADLDEEQCEALDGLLTLCRTTRDPTVSGLTSTTT